MLARRVIPVILVRDGALVKGRGFDSWRSVGNPMQAVRIHEARGVDELIVLDIGATPSGNSPDFDLIDRMAAGCFMPVTVGGGVRTVADMRRLLRSGADKVAVNTAAVECPGLIAEAAKALGSQAVCVSIDVKAGKVAARCGRQDTGLDPVAWARTVADLGAGEILLGAVDRDGTMAGYDLALIESVCRAVTVPVVAVGGAGSIADCVGAIEAGAHAVAASALFQFTPTTPRHIAAGLSEHGIPVRP